jgi:membrane-bound lytic murein transglycosylase B
VLAGIGTMESGNGRSTARGVHRGKNREGAEGPMQFEPATVAEYAVRADPSAKLTPYNPADAIFTAARMLCADGAATGHLDGIGVRSALIAGTGSGGPACAQVTAIRTGMVGSMADIEVTVAGLDDHPVHAKKGHGPVPVDTTAEQVAEGDFDALVIPGGLALAIG